MTKGHVRADASITSWPAQGPNAADRLLANKERVLTLWEERLRKTVAAAGREPSLILHQYIAGRSRSACPGAVS